MTFLKSRCWLLLFLFFLVSRVEAANVNLYPIAEVQADGWANVRRDIEADSPVMGWIKSGDTFAFQSVTDGYLILDGPFSGGYISSTFVVLSGDEFPLETARTDEVLIRAEPSATGRVVARVSKNSAFAVIRRGAWAEIKDGPLRGKFVASGFLQPFESASGAQSVEPMKVKVTPGEPAIEQPVPEGQEAISPIMRESKSSGAGAPTSTGAPSPVGAKVAAMPPPAPATPPPAPAQAVAPKASSDPASGDLNKPKWDEKQEARFNEQVEKAFKKKKSATTDNQVLMPVYFNNDVAQAGQAPPPTATVNARAISNTDVAVDAAAFFKLLHEHVIESWFDKPEVQALMPKGNANFAWVPVSAFNRNGIDFHYNEAALEIRVQVPPELRSLKSQSIAADRNDFGNGIAEKQPMFSSFLNINATEVYDSRNIDFSDRRSPLHAQLENGTNIGNFVLEAFGDYTEDRNTNGERNSFVRQDVRVVRDIQSWNARASVGDVVYPVQSFQVYKPLKGAAIYSQFSMDPSNVTYPTGDYSIFLKNKSKVFIYVNDQLQKVLELPAGRHQLKDFQYTSGMNNVRFEITDEFGQTEVQDHSYFSSTELLKKGLHQYSYAFGSPSSTNPTTGEREYDSKNQTISAFHRYGFSSYFSGGANVQNNSDQSVFGLEGTMSLKKGFLKIDPAYSHAAKVGSGYSVATRYTSIDYLGPEKTQRSLSAALTYRSDFFSEFGTTEKPTIARPFDIAVGYSRGLSKMMSANFGFNYIINKKITVDTSNSYAVRVGGSMRWSNGMSANLSAAHTRLATGQDDINIMGFLIWSFPKERQTISAYTNSADSTSRLGWSYNPSSGSDSASYQANYRDSQDEKGYGVNVGMNGNHARTGFAHEVVLSKKDNPATSVVESDKASNVTTLQLGTAFVFAGGHFGIGRPVTDSFAIIAPVKSLSGQKLLVNPDAEENYAAKSDWLGPAVVPEISSYNPATLVVGAKDLPPGLSIPQDHFNMRPRYKSGYGFGVGSDADVYLKFVVVGANKEPLEMVAGVAVNLDDKDAQPITLFTSRKGLVMSEGFKSGRYRLEMGTDKYQPIEFVVPKDVKQEYDLGTLQLKEK